MTVQSESTIIHHPEHKPTTTRITFDLNAHQEGEPGEWGTLRVNIATSDSNGGTHITNLTHIIVGSDWRERAAGIRQAFRTATLRRS